jgi:cell division protein FtsI (penicillin-binding protein 3)
MIKSKINFSSSLIFLVLIICLIKAFFLQVINRQSLLTYLKSQTLREVTVYPNRGSVFDRNGNPLALNIQTYSIFTIPKYLESFKDIKILKGMIPGLDFPKIIKLIKRRNKYTWIARNVKLSEEQVKKLQKIKGIYVERSAKRIYPNNSLAAQMLGFVGSENKGLSGVEYFFDEYLRGKPLIIQYIRDAKGRPVKFENFPLADKGSDLILTIDKDVQAFGENVLKNSVIENEAQGGGFGIIDAESGEIIAMANYPTFDANNYKKYGLNNRKLSFVTDPFEVGSVLKTFTVASALENGIANSETTYYCEQGKLKIGRHTINEAESNKKYEWLSTREILAVSSNVGTSKIAFDLTYPKLIETYGNFGLLGKTNIEIPAESKGILTHGKNVTPIHLSNISFGQGIANTGIQILAAYSVFANGGFKIKPTIIKKQSESSENPENEREQVLSTTTVNAINEMLIDAVEIGTGSNAKVPHFKIAGKTSTAQKIGMNGIYDSYISGFVGYPINVPKKFVIFVYIDSPHKGKYYGNLVAAPVFKQIAEYMLYRDKQYSKYAIQSAPVESDKVSMVQSSSIRSLNLGDRMPNLRGKDKKFIMTTLSSFSNRLKMKGSGLLVRQSPEDGVLIDENTQFRLFFENPSYE